MRNISPLFTAIATVLLLALNVMVQDAKNASTVSVKNVQVTPSIKEAEVGQEVKLTVVATDASGSVIKEQPSTYFAGPFDIAAADANGNVKLFGTGEVIVGAIVGGKPGFSYDERWIVYHHYVEADDWQSLGYASATDPAFVALRNGGAANLFLLDLTTGVEKRITTMGPGQYALFPHFRSDGWIYAIVRDNARGVEDMIASDAAL